ncbi:MAG: nucleotidyl transferase AbiEii/AbiGii toxin family protein [Euryarchaeota archaeon]|nr:nucleotidyl transferase AbiEii/AbiGii toxin family protein [Euryarchaeota archaeon]
MVELREARKIAAKIGLGLQYVLKEARVFDIWAKLSPIILSKELASQITIICKGGTVLNKVFLKGIGRFSEDLDFDAYFTKKLSKKEKMAFLDKNVLFNLRTSYQIERPRLMKDVVRFTCSFVNEMGAQDCVFVEFNLEPKGYSASEIKEAYSEILNIAPVKIPSYSFPVLVAKKIKTFYERGSGKDLYDIFYSLKMVKDVKEIINVLKSVLKFEGIEYKDFVKEFIRKLGDEKSIARVHASTNPYIPRKLRVDWIEIAAKVKDELEPYL